MSSGASWPTVRRRRLGAELRRLREANSLKLEEVAEQLGLAPSTLSRIETGKAPTKTAYLTSMLGMYGVDDPAVRKVLVDMAREGHRKGWWSIYDDVLPSGFDIYVGLEAEASGLRSYETDVVHGLLQTTEYALTVLRELRPRTVTNRSHGAWTCGCNGSACWTTTRHSTCGSSSTRARSGATSAGPRSWDRNSGTSSRPAGGLNVTLQVLGFEAGAHAGLVGPFSILDFPERGDSEVAYTESVGGMIYLEKEREVRACAEAFDRMRAAALSPSASVELIQQVLEELT